MSKHGPKKYTGTPEWKAFRLHKRGATRGRGIDFHFTFEEWVEWWEQHLGPNWLEKRGRKKNQYVMARYGDKGPYAPWNVKCITMEANAREQTKKVRTSKLTEDDVRLIYPKLKAGIWPSKIARRYKVAKCTIKDIKKKVTWSHVTDELD